MNPAQWSEATASLACTDDRLTAKAPAGTGGSATTPSGDGASKPLRLIFVGGAPRSGTSLLQKILDLHSEVFAGPEFDHLPHVMPLYAHLRRGIANRKQSVYYTESMVEASLRQFVLSLLVGPALERGKTIVCEKTPDNVLCFDSLAELFPEARFLFLVRDPRAIVHSMQQVQQRAATAGQHTQVGYNLAGDMRRIDSAMRAATRFRQECPDRLLPVSYEQLVSDPRPTVEDVCRFLSIGFEDDMLRTERENLTSQRIASRPQVFYTQEMYDRPIDASSREAWRMGLDRGTVAAIEDYFAHRSYALYEDYRLKKASVGRWFRHAPSLVRHRIVPRFWTVFNRWTTNVLGRPAG